MSGEQHDARVGELSKDVMFQICSLNPERVEVADDVLADLRAAERLARNMRGHRAENDALVCVMVTNALGRFFWLPPVWSSLPSDWLALSDSEARNPNRGWVDRAEVERVLKNLLGLLHIKKSVEAISIEAEVATSKAIKTGLLGTDDYDAWRPGMASGSGQIQLLKATPYGLRKALAVANEVIGTDWYYLEASGIASPELHSRIFCKIEGRRVAERVARLLEKQYPEWFGFGAIAVSSVDADERLFIDREIERYAEWAHNGRPRNLPDETEGKIKWLLDAEEWAVRVRKQPDVSPPADQSPDNAAPATAAGSPSDMEVPAAPEQPAAQPASDPATSCSDCPDDTYEPADGSRERDVLLILWKHQAFQSHERMKTEDIAAELRTDPSNLKVPVAALASHKLVRTKGGRGGGCWLSPIGREVAGRLFGPQNG